MRITFQAPVATEIRSEEFTLPIYSRHNGLDRGEVYHKLDAGPKPGTLVLYSIWDHDDGNYKPELHEYMDDLGINGTYYLALDTRHRSSAAEWDWALTRLRAFVEKFMP